jgi:protease I
MNLKGKRVIILVEQLYNEFELWYPYYRLKEAEVDVVVVGSGSAKEYKSKYGLPCKVDISADQVSADEFDGIIIPGGYAPDYMRRYPAMVELVKDIYNNGKVVAGICHAGWMLASAEIVEDRTVTSFYAIKDDLIHTGASWIDKEVVIDGKLITSRKPADLPAFMKAVITNL